LVKLRRVEKRWEKKKLQEVRKSEGREGEYEVSSGRSSEGERSESVPVDRGLTDTKQKKRRATLSPQALE